MALILPKGIVVNSPDIVGTISERINTEPLDLADIAKFWKVYTTTKRRLLDPTAERLENYWWRIWGSRRRELTGTTVARLFAEISDGETFVPLRGPPNRDEGPRPLKRNTNRDPETPYTTVVHQASHSRPSTTSSSTTSQTPAVLPHPILKKTRGRSITGPRPTARFISPHESEDGMDQASSISPNSHIIVQPPSPDLCSPPTDKKLSAGVSRKKGYAFVASHASKKKRPLIVRRGSSQASQFSADNTAKASGTTEFATSVQSPSEFSPPKLSDQSQARRKLQGQALSNIQNTLSPPAAAGLLSPRRRNTGKAGNSKNATSRKSAQRARNQYGLVEQPALEVTRDGDPGPSTRSRLVGNRQTLTGKLAPEELDEIEVQGILLEEANARIKNTDSKAGEVPQAPHKDRIRILHAPVPEESEGQLESPGAGPTHLLPLENKSAVTLAPTLAAAAGHMDLGGTADVAQQATIGGSRVLDKGKGRDPDDLRRTDMFAKRPVQSVATDMTSPYADASSSLSRSKSQLTLLLEKDRARSGDQNLRNINRIERGDKQGQ